MAAAIKPVESCDFLFKLQCQEQGQHSCPQKECRKAKKGVAIIRRKAGCWVPETPATHWAALKSPKKQTIACLSHKKLAV